MFDRDNDARYLQSRLEAFIDHWHGYRKPWFGIAADKIAQTQLPQPLAWLYGYAGEWQGRHYWDTLLGNQDCLIHFEDLSIRDGKLVFVNENQGVWQVGTETDGEDPPVWVSVDDGPWRLLDDSLTQFLVTFVLHETVFGCEHLGSSDDVIGKLRDSQMHVAPLWLYHPYPAVHDGAGTRPLSFHIANGTHLIMDNCCCAINVPAPWDALPEVFKRRDTNASSHVVDRFQPFPDHIQVPSFIRRSHLEDLIRQHDAEVKYHQDRCDLYRKLLTEMEADSST
jgi:hypothetical protein